VYQWRHSSIGPAISHSRFSPRPHFNTSSGRSAIPTTTSSRARFTDLTVDLHHIRNILRSGFRPRISVLSGNAREVARADERYF
jgi:hypothetical protein